MTCYHPLIRAENLNKTIRAKDGHVYHPATIRSPFDWELETIKDNLAYNQQLIPCGRCIGCKLDYAREWANRGYLESKSYEQNYFVTITYDPVYLPYKDEITTSSGITYTDDGTWNGTLVPEQIGRAHV